MKLRLGQPVLYSKLRELMFHCVLALFLDMPFRSKYWETRQP